MLYLYDSNGNLIKNDDDSGDGNASRLKQALAAGEYYLMVRAYSDSSTIDQYDLSVSRQELSFTEPNDTFETAYDFGTVEDVVSADLKIDYQGDQDYYKFSVPRPLCRIPGARPCGRAGFSIRAHAGIRRTARRPSAPVAALSSARRAR